MQPRPVPKIIEMAGFDSRRLHSLFHSDASRQQKGAQSDLTAERLPAEGRVELDDVLAWRTMGAESQGVLVGAGLPVDCHSGPAQIAPYAHGKLKHPARVSCVSQLFYDDSHVGDPPRGKGGQKATTLWEDPSGGLRGAAVSEEEVT